jgi:hypothetical protein
VAHDVGNTYFNLGSGVMYKPANRPPAQYQSVDAAIAIFPYNGRNVHYVLTAEWRDVQNAETQDMYRRLHAGMEINVGDVLYLRAGMNQRYYTAGLELAIDRQQIQLATYGEEIGTPTRFREDRRFLLQYAFRF